MEGVLEPADFRVIYINVYFLLLFLVLLSFPLWTGFIILQKPSRSASLPLRADHL